jgi:DNA-binding transcriptional MocR family regulator
MANTAVDTKRNGRNGRVSGGARRVDAGLLYEQVAARVEKMIEQGVLRPGEKVPSVRQLSERQKVSMSTAFQAYFLLESKGLIESRPRSGFYVSHKFRELPPEPARTRPSLAATEVGVDELVARVFTAAGDPEFVPLGAATPSTALLPVNRLRKLTIDLVRSRAEEALAYDYPPGNAALRRQIARRSIDWSGSLTADEIVTTSGCLEGLNLSLRAVARPGDTIAIETPTYFGVLQAIESLGLKALEIATDPRTGICLDALERALNRHRVKACLVVPNFNQPLGSLMPDDRKEALVAMMSDRGIPLIEDDLYGDLYFGTERPRTLKSYDREGMVLHCSSFSKTIAPGYRVGWAAPGKFRDQVERLKYMTSVATASLPQMVIAEFLKDSAYDRHLRSLRHAFAVQTQLTAQAVAGSFPEGTRVTRPQGGFVLWVEMPESVDSLDLHRRALERKISIAPGPIFSANGRYRNFIRLNCGYPWSDRIEHAIATLGTLASR